MRKQKTVTLDFTNCKYLGVMHQIIKEAFHFPDWYGENWSAFWDMGYDYIRENTHIIIKGTKTMPNDFEESIQIMLEILQRIHDESSETITFELVD